jgi:phospholipid transport system substrate-binding protein
MMPTPFRLLALAAAFLVLSFVAPGARSASAETDPAIEQIKAFDQSLLGVMKQAKTLGIQGRYRVLEPAIDRSFDIPAMTRFSVGPRWATMSEPDRDTLTKALRRFTIASYAHNFTGYDGERFDVDPVAEVRGADRIVKTRIIASAKAPVSINYRMRESGHSWRIIDVYYGAISQLTTRRADFAASLAAGGAPELVTHLNALSDAAMR